MDDLDDGFVTERPTRINKPRGSALHIRRADRYDPALTPGMYGISEQAVGALLWLRSALRQRQIDFTTRLARKLDFPFPQQYYAMIELRQAVIDRAVADALCALMNDALAALRRRSPGLADQLKVERFTWQMLVTPPGAAGDQSLADLGSAVEADDSQASA